MHRSLVCYKNASTAGGMRKILKQHPSPQRYIRQAVEAGTYTKPPPDQRGGRGRQNNRSNAPNGASIENYPIEYQILTLHPLPTLQTYDGTGDGDDDTNNKVGKDGKQKGVDPLVKAYLQRNKHHLQEKLMNTSTTTEEEYYQRLLGIPRPPSSSAMGQKSSLLNKAYAFAVKQHELMRQDDGMTEDESLAMVERLLTQENQSERQESRKIQKGIVQNATATAAATTLSKEPTNNDDSDEPDTSSVSSSSTPSILHSKPRTIQAMHLWSQRLKAVPYKEWTVGATVALDHWVARSILELSEETYHALMLGEDPSLTSRGKDVLITRQALFPETIMHERYQEQEEDDRLAEHAMDMDNSDDDNVDDLNDNTNSETNADDKNKSSADKSIDELLASLGGFEDDDEDNQFWNSDEHKLDDGSDDGLEMDERVQTLVDDLQVWRAKNVDMAYQEWSQDTKDEFETWIKGYVTVVTKETDIKQVDLEATREALLSLPPTTKQENDVLWNKLADEAEAELLLHSMRVDTNENANANSSNKDAFLALSDSEKTAVGTFLELEYETQLQKLVQVGTLRPLLDEYTTDSDRMKFLARHSTKMLEGVEVEHLVPDPDGAITGADILGKATTVTSSWKQVRGKDSAGAGGNPEIQKEDTFTIQKIPYGTDEFGTTQASRAREIFKAWNTHKVGRALYEERMFKEGKLGLRYSSKDRSPSKPNGKE